MTTKKIFVGKQREAFREGGSGQLFFNKRINAACHIDTDINAYKQLVLLICTFLLLK